MGHLAGKMVNFRECTIYLGVATQICFMFTLKLGGKGSQFDLCIFSQMGWFNPELELHRGLTYCVSKAQDASILGTFNDFARIPGEDTPNFPKYPKRRNSFISTVGETPGVPSTWMCQEVRING